MINYNSLPYEIKTLILQHIDSTKQLGECRLVSKSWDKPAECAMFNRQLHITDYNTKSLYRHLQRKPERANLIKELWFDCQIITGTTLALLEVAITPSIERITSKIANPDPRLYLLLANKVKNMGVKLQRLKSIPWPDLRNVPRPFSFTTIQYETMMLFKDTLEEIKIPTIVGGHPHQIAQHLDEYKRLTLLYVVNCGFEDLSHAESIFRGAHHLKEIRLRNCHLHEMNWSSEERLRWMKQNVEINHDAIILKAIDDFNLAIDKYTVSAPVIEYFIFKYPNIKHFDHNADYYDGDTGTVVESDERICLEISKMPSYTLNLRDEDVWRSHYTLFIGHTNQFQFYYGNRQNLPDNEATNHISSRMEQGQQTRSSRFQFWIAGGAFYGEANLIHHIKFLKTIAAFTTTMNMNFVQYDFGSDRHMSRVFFKAMEVMNHLKSLEFVSTGELAAVELDIPHHYEKRQLNALRTVNTEIQPIAFHTLDRLFHAITVWTLSCCYIKEDPANTTRIHLPSTSVERLILNMDVEYATEERFDQCDFKEMILLTHDTYIVAKVQQLPPFYFKLEPFKSDVHQISFMDYLNRPAHATAFSIYCRTLASIQMELGDICANIDIQMYIAKSSI